VDVEGLQIPERELMGHALLNSISDNVCSDGQTDITERDTLTDGVVDMSTSMPGTEQMAQHMKESLKIQTTYLGAFRPCFHTEEADLKQTGQLRKAHQMGIVVP
jgi:hypothetical protein